MNNKCEQEYIDKVDRLIVDLKFQLNNPPQSMKVKDPGALKEANSNVDEASQKLNGLKTGAIMIGKFSIFLFEIFQNCHVKNSIGAGAGAFYGAKIGLTFGPYAAVAGAIVGAVAGGLIGAGLANILIDVLKLLDNAHIQWERAYGIKRTGCS